MKRLAALAFVVVLLAVAGYYIVSGLADAAGGEAGPSPDGASQGAPPASAPARPGDPAPPEEAMLSHVAYVHDGDTLYLQPDGTTARADEVTVRLLGVDTPELRPEVECYGPEARDRLRALLPQGAAVWIAEDEDPVDQYGRTLLYLWTEDGDFVNLRLVAEGYAEAVNIAPNDAYWPELLDAERAAMDAGAGRWGRC
jgi:micrococcal nuclease